MWQVHHTPGLWQRSRNPTCYVACTSLRRPDFANSPSNRHDPIGVVDALLGGLAVAVGTLLPWYRISGYVVSGTDIRDGYFVLVAGIVVATLAIYGLISGRAWLRPLLFLASGGTLALGVLRAIDVVREAQAWQASLVDFAGLGILIVLAGGLVATVASLANLRSR